MSHNVTKVCSKSPDNTGNITVELNDLTNLSGAPSSTNVLAYDGTNWINTSNSANTSLPYSYHSVHSSWGASGYEVRVDDWIGWRKLSGSNEMIGGPYTASFWEDASAAHMIISNTKWCMGFNLPVGTWFVKGVVNFRHNNTSNYLDIGWFDGSGNQYSNLVRSARGRTSSVTVWGLVDISSATQIFLKCVSKSGTIYIPTGPEHRCIAYQFTKLK
jgi:hypothetical protein